MNELGAALNVAVEACHAAGQIHLEHWGRGYQVASKSSFSDLVTEVDTQAEAAIRRILGQHYPEHSVLGEEEGLRGAADHPYRWVIDPLDGTVNYAHGFPVFAVSIALERYGERVVGAVFDPSRQELFTALRGGGAFLNDKPIRVSPTPKLMAPALLATGFPYDTSGEENLRHVAKLLRLGLPIRRPGAAALDLCNVACGRMDGYWELGLKPWDSAAGSLIVEEAGGQVTNERGEKTPYSRMIVASNGLIHAELLQLLGQE